MHVVFFLARVFPYWAFSLALVFFELGVFFRRRGSKWKLHCFGVAAFFVLGIVAWLVFRGDLHSDQWIRSVVALFKA